MYQKGIKGAIHEENHFFVDEALIKLALKASKLRTKKEVIDAGRMS
jgi:hypothetical protein